MKTPIGFAKFCIRASLMFCLFITAVGPAFAYDDPPTRVARLSFVQGNVSFQPSGERDWGWAALNRPMTFGDSLWTGERSRAEMHIGSTAIRVGERTSVSFLNLDDRTVQIQLSSGTIDVRVRNLYRDDVFEVDTPNVAFSLLQRGDYRITVDPDGYFTTITLREGQGQVTGGGQAFLVEGGSQVQVSGTDYISYDIYDLPARDDFDRWSYSRQQREDRSQSVHYVSAELTGYEDLDQNGSWRIDIQFGPVWIPTRVSRDWAPYREGHWAWIEPWGWTWVDDASFGFVTSHYGRWASVNDGRGGRSWAWVPPHREANQQEVYAQRPVYSPALVTFVGDSNSSRDFGRGGRVAWFALAPGEVYVPAYQASPTYVTNVNIRNTVVQQTTITNVVTNNIQTNVYVNQRVEGAVTAVPRETFVNAQPVAQAAVKVAPNTFAQARTVPSAQVAPVKASVMGANKPIPQGAGSPGTTTSPAAPERRTPDQTAPAMTAPPKPPTTVVDRQVVAKAAPPPPPIAFAQKQAALQANPGKPLDAKTEQNIRVAAPTPIERVVKTAPPAPVVKPVETEAKKPQPVTSPNTVQQVHPAAPGAPVAAPGSPLNAQQQQEAEKAKQQAAQQQTVQQQVAAEKAKQEAAQQQAAADKAKQEAAQQQAAADRAKQQAAQQQTAQQQTAAEKARQEAAQQQALQQQAAADKAKQQAAQQQILQQQLESEKAKQQAAEKARQEAAQQQAAQQQLAAEKAKQEAAQQQAAQQQLAAEKAKQQAAQQQADQQRMAAEKAKQEAAQQQAAQQQLAAEKAKQQAAQQQADQQRVTAEKAKQEAAQQQAAQQQLAAEKAKQQASQQQADQQRMAAEKAKQEAAQQQAAQQQLAAEKAKQQAAQQQAAQQQAAEKAKQEAAQQQAAQQQLAAERAKQQAAQQQAAEKAKQEAAQQQAAQQQAAANSGPIRVPENGQSGKLVSQPKLNYPVDAKGARIQGTVRVQVSIGADGRVKNAVVLSGPASLQAAALENARQRQYQPTLVGGRPVEVETEISIVF